MPSGGRPWNRLAAQLRAERRDCWICKQPISYDALPRTPLAFSVDHITPTSHGGTDARSNLAAAHYGCNSSRGNLARGDFPTSRAW